MNTPVNFKIAKLLKEKGFDDTTLHFYTKPNTKMFGIDEHGRYYPMKNKAKSLWTMGNAAALKIENVYQAPTIAEVVMWLYEKHGIWIIAIPVGISTTWCFSMFNVDPEKGRIIFESPSCNSPTEAYEAGIEYILNNLIK